MVTPDISSDKGVILTIGFVGNDENASIVIPVGNPDYDGDASGMAADAAQSFIDQCMAHVTACISELAYVSFISAEPMMNGGVPFRADFSSSTYIGERTGAPLTSNTGALIGFYSDAATLPVGSKTREGKNTIPFISQEDRLSDIISDALIAILQAFADDLFNGFASTADPGNSWYRVIASPASRTVVSALIGIAADYVRGYVVTQRRRLLPRP